MDFSAQHVLLIGLDAQGFALARHLRQVQASVCLLTIAGEEQTHAQELAELLQDPQISLRTCVSLEQEESHAVLAQMTLLVWTPSAVTDARYRSLLDSNLPYLTELDVFALALSDLRLRYGYAPKVIAITGSNGKTTVTNLVRQFAQRAGHQVQVLAQQAKLTSLLGLDFTAAPLAELAAAHQLVPDAAPADAVILEPGEASPSMPELKLAAPLPAEIAALPTIWVLLLNTSQLRLSSHLQADAASVLNVIAEDEGNAADMARIFSAQTVRVLNRDDVHSIQMQPRMIASLKDEAQIAKVVSFGSHEPQAAECLGLSTERGVQWLSVAVEVDESAQEVKPKRRKKGELVLPAEIELKHLMPADALKIFGQHNACNALAALALCRAIGLSFAPLLHGLREYKGEAQRLEWLRSLAEVNWYDDSASQNLAASVAGLKAIASQLNSDEQAIIWILQAGQHDFGLIAEQLPQQLRNVIVLEDANLAMASQMLESMVAAWLGSNVQFYLAAGMAAALAQAAQLAKSGDAVLFSPAKQGRLTGEMQEALQELALTHGELV